MPLNPFINELRQDISRNRISEAITKIQQLFEYNRSGNDAEEFRKLDNQVVQLARRYQANKDLSIVGAKSPQDKILIENQISDSLIEFIEQLRATSYISPFSIHPWPINGYQESMSQKLLRMVIKIDKKFEAYTKEEAITTLKKIDKMISIGDPLELKDINEGCVKLEIEISQEQVKKLQELYANNALIPLKVIGCFPKITNDITIKSEKLEDLIHKNIMSRKSIVFDIDTTLTSPKEKSSSINNFSSLYSQLLKQGNRITIISGNKDITRIYEAIKKELPNDLSVLEGLTLYVNGGGTKISFNRDGQSISDLDYFRNHGYRIANIKPHINAILKKTAKSEKPFGLNQGELGELAKVIKLEYPGIVLNDKSWQDPEFWAPEWITDTILKEKIELRESITYPWVEMNDFMLDNEFPEGIAASLAIQPLPETISYNGVNKILRPSLLKSIQEGLKETEFKNHSIEPSSEMSININLGKKNVMKDLIQNEGSNFLLINQSA